MLSKILAAMRLNASLADIDPSTISMKKPFMCPLDASITESNLSCYVASLAQLGTISLSTEFVISIAN